jgi:hypothetical protein
MASAGRIDASGGQRQPARMALAERIDDVRADHCGQDAETGFADGEARVVGGNRDVACASQAHTAAECRALHAGDGGLGAGLDACEHGGEPARVLEVVLLRGLARALHPLQVGAGAEVLAVASQHDHAHVRRNGQLRKRGVELGDHRLVEGVEHRRTRHGDLRHARCARRDFQARHQ